jgi:HSP20 family protein
VLWTSYGLDQFTASSQPRRPSYEVSDLEAARQPHTILAYDFTYDPLPLPHGAPLRVHVETALGERMVKDLRSRELIAEYPAAGDGQGGSREPTTSYGRGTEIWTRVEHSGWEQKALEPNMTQVHEQAKQQQIPVKVYRTADRLMIAAPMAGLEPENILVEVTNDGRLILHGDQRALLKDVKEKELLIDEWSIGVYHRELALPVPVNAVYANLTYGNGVLLVAVPISDQTSPARLTLERVTPTHGEHQGNTGHLDTSVQTRESIQAQDSIQTREGV